MLNANAQINNTRLSKESEYIFRFTKTKLTNAEKNFFAKDYKLEYRKEEKDTVLTIEDINSKNHQRIRATVEVITVDINNDGKDEVFVRESDEYSSPDIQDLSLYIKNERGIYVRQEGVYSPEFFVRSTSNGGWPDLIGGPGGGPGMDNNPPSKFDVYRWDGGKYKLFKKNQPHLKSDKQVA